MWSTATYLDQHRPSQSSLICYSSTCPQVRTTFYVFKFNIYNIHLNLKYVYYFKTIFSRQLSKFKFHVPFFLITICHLDINLTVVLFIIIVLFLPSFTLECSGRLCCNNVLKYNQLHFVIGCKNTCYDLYRGILSSLKHIL